MLEKYYEPTKRDLMAIPKIIAKLKLNEEESEKFRQNYAEKILSLEEKAKEQLKLHLKEQERIIENLNKIESDTKKKSGAILNTIYQKLSESEKYINETQKNIQEKEKNWEKRIENRLSEYNYNF